MLPSSQPQNPILRTAMKSMAAMAGPQTNSRFSAKTMPRLPLAVMIVFSMALIPAKGISATWA